MSDVLTGAKRTIDRRAKHNAARQVDTPLDKEVNMAGNKPVLERQKQLDHVNRYFDVYKMLVEDASSMTDEKAITMARNIEGLPMYENHNGRRNYVTLYHRGNDNK